MFKPVERKCLYCGASFQGAPYAKYCSKACRKKYWKRQKIVHKDPPDGVPILNEFRCKECGKTVLVWEDSDKRTVLCSRQCEEKFWKHDYLQGSKHSKSGNNISPGMSLGSLIQREKMDEV